MEKEKVPAPPREGIVYGEIAYWLLVTGVIIAISGLIVYITSQGYIDKASLLNYLWRGVDCHTIWKDLGGVSQPPAWYSSLGMLSKGDMLAMLGIAVSCLAAVLGMWGTAFQMVRSKGKLYLFFALIIAVVLTFSALGLITMGD
jgi:magnesium-transporting ATPase (P-type)